ncbi:MAG: hypothetical protein ACREDZ_05190 [Kiloniellales bacterium]
MASKFLSVVAGLSMFAVAGVASAGEPTKLTAAQMDGITAAGGTHFDTFIRKQVFETKQVFLDIFKNVDSNVRVRNNLATAEGSADAFGSNSLSEVSVFSQTTPFSSESFAQAVSATNDPGCHICRAPMKVQ